MILMCRLSSRCYKSETAYFLFADLQKYMNTTADKVFSYKCETVNMKKINKTNYYHNGSALAHVIVASCRNP